MIRDLNKYEKYQVNLTRISYLKNKDKPYDYRKFFISILLMVVFSAIIYFLDESWLSFISKFGLVIVPMFIWFSIQDYRGNRKRSKKIISLLNDIKLKNGIEVESYKISKAILFEIFEDEGECYALELDGKEETLFLWNFISLEYTKNFPSTEIEIYSNDFAKEIFGRSCNSFGDFIEPIILSGEIKRNIFNLIPEHNSIINMSIDQYLDKIINEAK